MNCVINSVTYFSEFSEKKMIRVCAGDKILHGFMAQLFLSIPYFLQLSLCVVQMELDRFLYI